MPTCVSKVISTQHAERLKAEKNAIHTEDSYSHTGTKYCEARSRRCHQTQGGVTGFKDVNASTASRLSREL